MKKHLGLLLFPVAALGAAASCSSAPPAAVSFDTTTSTIGTIPPDRTAGAPAGAIKVEIANGPVWVDGALVYAEGCKARALTDASVTELLKAKNTTPPAPNKTFNLICKPGTN